MEEKPQKQPSEWQASPRGACVREKDAVCVWCDVIQRYMFKRSNDDITDKPLLRLLLNRFFFSLIFSPLIAVYANDMQCYGRPIWYISTERQITAAAELQIISAKAPKCSHAKPSGKKAHGAHNYSSCAVKVTDRCLNCLHRCATD